MAEGGFSDHQGSFNGRLVHTKCGMDLLGTFHSLPACAVRTQTGGLAWDGLRLGAPGSGG